MDFFSKLGDSIVSATQEVGEKAKGMTDVAKLQYEMRSKEDFLNKQYQEIGKIFYQENKDAAPEAYTSLFEEVVAAQKRIEEIKEQMLTVNNMAISGKPDDLVINTHVCRGNFHSTYASSGAYDSVAETLLARENVNAYYLEFDDTRSGGFEPLASVSGEKKVVLGLVTTKRPELESKDAVIARIHEAAKHLPLDRLYLSPQCGFASCEIGNKLTEAQQWAKLALVKEIAEEVWG